MRLPASFVFSRQLTVAGIVSASFASACSTATTVAAQEGRIGCISPITARTWDLIAPDSVQGSEAVAGFRIVRPRLSAPVRLEDLTGDYTLTLVATVPEQADTIATGRMRLHPTPPSARARIFPVYGWTDVDLHRLGVRGLAHSAADPNPQRPGMQPLLSQDGRQLTFSLGNAVVLADDGTPTVIRRGGATAYVFDVTATMLRGWWKADGQDSRPRQGYFCAVREGSHPSPS